jgi:hypothetical protein
MARIIVQADDRRTVLLDEQDVRPEHIHDEHAAAQLIERLEWAVKDEFRRTKVRRPRTALPLAESALTRSFD